MLAVVTTLWKRHALERCTLRRLSRAFPSAKKIAAVSEVAAADLAEAAGWVVVEAPNVPLGRKFNAAAAAAEGCDGIVIFGSDNWITDGAEAFYAGLACDYFGLLDVYQVAAQGARHFTYRNHRVGEPIGAGRFVAKSVLDALGWAPWPQHKDRTLDREMTARLRGHVRNAKTMRLSECDLRMIGIKTGVNITPWRLIADGPNTEHVSRRDVLASFPQDEVRELTALLAGA